MSAPLTTLHYYRGRVALSAILRGLGVRPGDEAILQAYTCVAVPSPLIQLGMRPVYADIDRRSLTVDVNCLRQAITRRTRAIVVQHTFGIPADLSGALALAREAGIPVIEDCAHVLGASLRGQPLGTFGAAAFFSYEWGKPVVAGVGGKAIVNDPALAHDMRANYGSFAYPPLTREFVMSLQYLAHRAVSQMGLFWKVRAMYRKLSTMGLIVGSYDEDPGTSPEYGWRMTRTVRMRLARREALARERLEWRREIAARYRAGFRQLGMAELAAGEDTDAVLMRVPVVVTAKQRVLELAVQRRVEMGDWYSTPVHPLTGRELEAVGYRQGSCPNAEWAADYVVTLPVRTDTRLADVDRALDLFSDSRVSGHA